MEYKRAWYILYTNPGSEAQFYENLVGRLNQAGMADRLLDFIIPDQTPADISQQKGEADEQIGRVIPYRFPGAVFALLVMDETVWPVVRDTPGLTGFAGRGERPTAYLRSVGTFEKIPAAPGARWQPGNKVRIINGAFNELRGVVIEVNEARGKVRVMIDLFNRVTPVELDFEQIEKEWG